MSGDTNVEAPKPTPQEQALQQEQVNLLRDQRSQTQAMINQQNMLAPYLYEQLGLTPTMKDGKIVGFTKAPEDPSVGMFKDLQTKYLQSALAEANDPTNKEISSLMKGRTLAALKGELPTDPALERNLTEGRGTLEESLRKQLGGGYSTSSAGIEALANYDKRAEELRYGARRDQLTLSEQLRGADEALTENRMNSPLAGVDLSDRLRTSKLGSLMSVSGLQGQGVAGLGNVAGGYNAPLSWYQNNRNMQYNANAASAAGNSNMWGTLGSLVGTGIATYGAYALAASDRRLKTDIQYIGTNAKGFALYRYTIKGKARVGVMADEVAKIKPEAVTRSVGGFDVVNYAKIH